MPVNIKSQEEIDIMRTAGGINAEVREILKESIAPGITGAELDQIAKNAISDRGGLSTFVGYSPWGKPAYPGAICFSVNEVLVHGIPNSRVLVEGDIVSIDLGVTYQGYVSDAAFTTGVGVISDEAQRLLNTTAASLDAGINASLVGHRIGDIGSAIGAFGENAKMGIVKGYGGHGVGREMHEDPHVPNHGKPGTGLQLKKGMVLALEPMFALGDADTYELEDQWSVAMVDGSLSAHFEHTIAIGENGPEVLTSV
jgi:methionyl aminopeptidase